jgi:signal transduction histidine kinase
VIITSLPIWAIDMVGSILMIVFSFLCLGLVRRLKIREPSNVIWTYLFWVCLGLAGFAVSRSAGHILKQILLSVGREPIWSAIRPYSGAINSLMFVFVASVTLFFERIWRIYGQISEDKRELQTVRDKLLYLNQNLENMVDERTQEIAQAEKLASIGQLSAGIAHEINNPLGIILGYTQLLIRNEAPETEKHNDLKTIEKHVRNCKSIVEDLLNFARRSKPKENAMRVGEAIDDVLSFIQQHAGLDDIEVQKSYDPSIPEMLLDEKKIKQVIMNLIMNAKHAVGQKGTLHITTSLNSSEDQVSIKIADTGHGIEKKNLAHIFDPFFTTKPTGEGTGLGLSVSYGIVRNHGGDILVDSEVGRGSTFTVMLPLASPDSRTENEKIHSYRR